MLILRRLGAVGLASSAVGPWTVAGTSNFCLEARANFGKCVGSPPFGLRTPCDGARCHDAVLVGYEVGFRHAVVAQEYSFGSQGTHVTIGLMVWSL